MRTRASSKATLRGRIPLSAISIVSAPVYRNALEKRALIMRLGYAVQAKELIKVK
jgi:hypothetical protein